MPVHQIEKLLNNDDRFLISQTFRHPFVDFKISHVGSTFEKLIGGETFVPSLKYLYDKFMSNHSEQFSNQKLNDNVIFGRVARMWASLIREWHSYYLLLNIGEKFKFDKTFIIRDDELDTKKGIDILLKNKKKEEKSIKLDILQSTGRANYFRKIKDSIRVKDKDIPGKKYKIFLGSNKETTKVINGWYLLDDAYAERIIIYYKKYYAK